MGDPADLSRRERQIMDIIYVHKQASVLQIQEGLPEAPSATAIRTLLRILEDKGHVGRRKQGREFIYLPTQPRRKAGLKALQHVLETFYEGSIEGALSAHLTGNKGKLDDEEIGRLMQLIRATCDKETK
jgi:predicted transcriptional regulator